MLEDRTVPTVVYDQTFNWSNIFGAASVHVTVTESAPDGEDQYLWNYQLTNDASNDWDFEMLAVSNKDPNGFGFDAMDLTIGNFGGDQEGWSGEPYGSPSRPIGATDEYLYWSNPDGLLPGGTVNLSFTTVPTAIVSGTGLVSQFIGGFANTIMGTIVGPQVPDPHEVTTKSDMGTMNDGRVSLREAVGYTLNHQDKGTDVWFGVGNPITLDPNKGQIELGMSMQTTEVNISGSFNGTTTIQYASGTQPNNRIFDVLQNTTVTLYELSLNNGKLTGAGGAVRSKGDLTVTECHFVNNEATSSTGGAIAAMSGSLHVSGLSTFTGNSAAQGGAIYIGERVTTTIENSQFYTNSATGQLGQGGAIYILSSTNATFTSVNISNVVMDENTAVDRGGGIMVSGVFEGGSGTDLVMSSVDLNFNVVSSVNGKGGGVFFGQGEITMIDVAFSSNEAPVGDGIYYVTGTWLDPNSTETFTDDTWASGPY